MKIKRFNEQEDAKNTINLEKKIQQLIDELNKINKEAEDGGDYKYLSSKYLWKMKVLKQTENKLRELLK